MPWIKVCTIQLDDNVKPTNWKGPEATKLAARDKDATVRHFVEKKWTKYKPIAGLGAQLEIGFDATESLFRLTITAPKNGSATLKKQITSLPQEMKKVVIDSKGNERAEPGPTKAPSLDDLKGRLAQVLQIPGAHQGTARQLFVEASKNLTPGHALTPEQMEALTKFNDLVDQIVSDKQAFDTVEKACQTQMKHIAPVPRALADQWTARLEAARGTAAQGKLEDAQDVLQKLLGAIAAQEAQQVTAQAGAQLGPEAQKKRKAQADRLAAIDKEIFERAELNFEDAAAKDSVLFAVATDDASRPIPKLKNFGSDEARQLLAKVKKSVNLAALTARSFEGIEGELNNAVLPGTKKEVLARAEGRGQQLISLSMPEFLTEILTLTPAQRQDEIVKSMGLLKDKYSGSGYDDLSADKQKLVDAICAGVESRLTASRDTVRTHCAAKGSAAMQENLAKLDPDSDQMFDLTLKSEADLKADVALALGLVSPAEVQRLKGEAALAVLNTNNPTYQAAAAVQLQWFAQLDPGQQAVVEATARGMLKAIDGHCPNKFVPAATPAQQVVQLNGEDYEFVEHVGKGGLGDIQKFKKKGSDETIIVKSLLKAEQRLDMERELVVHRLAMGGEGGKGHPNITPLKGVVRGPDGGLHMILEEAKGGDLEAVSGSVDFAVNTGVLPTAARTVLQQQFVRDAVAGLKALQEMNLTHHDIKPKNFLLTEDGTVMLADLGSGQLGQDAEGTVPGKADKSVNIPITPGVEAPEMHGQKASGKADTYTLGMMIHQMTGSKEAMTAPTSGAAPVVSALDKLTIAMLDEDPDKRPTLEAVENSSFLRDAVSHDPQQVAALKTATMRYAKLASKQLKMKTNDPRLKALDPGQTVRDQGSKSLLEVIDVSEREIRKARAELSEEEVAYQKLLQNARGPRIQAGIDEHARNPNKSAFTIAKELKLTPDEAKELTPYVQVKDRINTRQQLVAKNTKELAAIQTLVSKVLQADPAVQQAEQQLKAAAAPFSAVTENRLEPMPDLMKRFRKVGIDVHALQDLVPGTVVHAHLSTGVKAFMDAYDKKDALAARKQVRALEDMVARAVGDKQLQEDLITRQDYLFQQKQAAKDTVLVQMIQLRLDVLTNTIEKTLNGLLK